MFAWVKEHDKLKKHEAKELIENLFYHAVHMKKCATLSTVQIEGFEKAFRLIELNASNAKYFSHGVNEFSQRESSVHVEHLSSYSLNLKTISKRAWC